MSDQKISKGTQCIWAGESSSLMQGATQVPVVHSVGFGYKDVDEWQQVALGKKPGHIYGRNTNPTVHAFEQKVRQLENAEGVTSASTGMGIISSTLFAFTGSTSGFCQGHLWWNKCAIRGVFAKV